MRRPLGRSPPPTHHQDVDPTGPCVDQRGTPGAHPTQARRLAQGGRWGDRVGAVRSLGVGRGSGRGHGAPVADGGGARRIAQDSSPKTQPNRRRHRQKVGGAWHPAAGGPRACPAQRTRCGELAIAVRRPNQGLQRRPQFAGGAHACVVARRHRVRKDRDLHPPHCRGVVCRKPSVVLGAGNRPDDPVDRPPASVFWRRGAGVPQPFLQPRADQHLDAGHGAETGPAHRGGAQRRAVALAQAGVDCGRRRTRTQFQATRPRPPLSRPRRGLVVGRQEQSAYGTWVGDPSRGNAVAGGPRPPQPGLVDGAVWGRDAAGDFRGGFEEGAQATQHARWVQQVAS